VNPLGEHRLQDSRISLEALRRDLGRLAGKDLFEAGIQRVQRRKATIIASSSMERIVDLASLGPVGRSATVSRCFHFATIFWLIP
jgi:hypothetical protein